MMIISFIFFPCKLHFKFIIGIVKRVLELKAFLFSFQELTEQFHQVESQLNKLNHLLTDILADVKTKRKILASNKLHQMERELYVYFLKDEGYLKEIVENLEKQSKIKAVGLKD